MVLLGVAFFLSGAAALVYQVVWQRILTLHTGSGIVSVSLIVAAFMAGLGLGSLVNVLNPDCVTISGGLLAMGEMFLGPMREAMYSLAYGPAAGTLVRVSTLGDDAGLLGAAAVALEYLEAR